MSYQKEREAFISRFVLEGGTLADARAILRDAATLQRLAVTACNRELTARENAQENACELRLTKRVASIGVGTFGVHVPVENRDAGFRVTVCGAPRGYVVKLHFPSGAYNNWGGKESGYGVPTRSF